MGFYRCDMRYEFVGQQMQNTLYYRERDPSPGDLVVKSTELGEILTAHFFPGVGAQWLSLYPSTAHLVEWAIMPYADIGFGPALTSPVLNAIDRVGYGPDTVLPPGNCVILRFLLRTASLGSGLYFPRRSYISFGPVPEVHVDPTGHLESAATASYGEMGALLASNVGTLGGAGGFAPVRFGQGPSPLFLRGFAEVDGCTPKSTISYRKSRQPE